MPVEETLDKKVRYLVTESNGKTHLPVTDANGKPSHRLMGAAWAALHGGYRGNKYEGPDKQGAIKRLKSMYRSENMETPSEKAATIDEALKSILTDVIQNRAYGNFGKGMYTVSRFSSILEDLKYLWLNIEYEREAEGDESPATDDLKEIFTDLLDNFLDYTSEQVLEELEHVHEKVIA